jgi:arylsulfatase A-like enzyme
MKETNLSRREFLRIAALSTVALSTGCVQQVNRHSSSKKRLNIIFLLTDDQRARTLSISDHPIINTPSLDRLASNGVRFTNAFVADPTCMPSRVTFLTGLYERVHGVGFSSEHDLTQEQWSYTYPALLGKNGYYTGFIGKLGVERYPFRGSPLKEFDFWRGHDGWASFFPKAKTNCQTYKDSEEDIVTPIMAESMERFLDSRPEDKPFCLSVSFSAPHGSISGSMFPEEGGGNKRMTRPADENVRLQGHPIYGGLYRDNDIDIPKECGTDTDPHIPTDILRQEGRKRTYSYAYTRETCIEHHYRYYQLITGIDQAVGQLLDSLRKRGLYEDTVIIFSSDHGLLMGEYGMGGKALLYDLTTKVPLVVYDPTLPKSKRGKDNDEFVLSTDVAPTILEYAGIKPPDFIQGRSLVKLIHDSEIDWRKDIFVENLYTGRFNPLIEAVREKGWKYVRYFPNPGHKNGREVLARSGYYVEEDIDFRGKQPIYEQLFNLETDPQENHNMVGNSKYNSILKRLRKRCEIYSSNIIAEKEKYRIMLGEIK